MIGYVTLTICHGYVSAAKPAYLEERLCMVHRITAKVTPQLRQALVPAPTSLCFGNLRSNVYATDDMVLKQLEASARISCLRIVAQPVEAVACQRQRCAVLAPSLSQDALSQRWDPPLRCTYSAITSEIPLT